MWVICRLIWTNSTPTSSTISLCHSFVYLRESLIWKGEVGYLVWVEYLQTLFYGLTRGISNFCETASLITSSLSSGVKSIGWPVLWSSFVHMEAKEKLNVEYFDIEPTLLQNPANLLNPDWIFNSGRQFSEWAIVFLYFPRYQVKIEYFLFVSTHVTSSSFMDSASTVALSMLTGESGK